MEDNQHRSRPACVPASGMGQSELAAAAVERQSWPAHHATDLEGMSTATSPGLSMLSTLSDSVGGSPVPASPAALWAEARLLQQQQQQQQFCELPEAEPVTPSADMRQYLYWQSFQQQQQQQLVSTAQYPPDGSSTASSAQMPQQEAESVLRSLPQHILAMSHGTGSHLASPHSPMCAELLHAGQYVDQPSTSRSHDNLRALHLPILVAGSPAQGSARQPALHVSPQHAAGASSNTAQCATYQTPALPFSTEAHPAAQLGNHHTSDDYSSSSSRYSTVSSLAAPSGSSPARPALASLAGAGAEPDLQAAAAAAAAATAPQTSSLAAAGAITEGRLSQGRLQQLAVPTGRAAGSTGGSGWQQLALRMMAVAAAVQQSEQAADTGPGPSDTLHGHSCHTGGQGFMPRVPARRPPHAAAAAAAASTHAAQASYVGSLETLQPWPAPAAAGVALASAHGSSRHHWDASITQHPAAGLASPHFAGASPAAAAQATGRPAVARAPPAQQALAVAGMPPHFAQLSAAGAQASPSQPQPPVADHHSTALQGGEPVWLHGGVQGMQQAAAAAAAAGAAAAMPAAADAAYTHAAAPAWMHQTLADAGPGCEDSSRRSSTQDAAATAYYALAASAAQLQGSPAAMPHSLSPGWGAAVQPAAIPALQQPLWQGAHAPDSMLQREPTFTPTAADAIPAPAQTAQSAAATASATASGGLPGWQQLAASTVYPPSRISPQPGAIMQALQEAVGATTGTGPSRVSAAAEHHAQLASVAQGSAGAGSHVRLHGFPAAEPSSYGHPGFSPAQPEEAFCSAGQPAASRYTTPSSRGPPTGSYPLQTPMTAPIGLQGTALPGPASGGLVWPAGAPRLSPAGLGGPAAMLLHQQQQQQGTSTYGELGGAPPGYTQVHSRPGQLTGFGPAGLVHQAAAAAGFQDTTALWHSMGQGQQQEQQHLQQQQQAATAAHPLLSPALPQLLQPAPASAGPGPLLLTQQQQLEQLIRMQQLQLLQLQLQVQAVAGATAAPSNPAALFGAALQPSALQAAALWSHAGLLGHMPAQPLFPGGLHPAQQHPAQVAAVFQPLPQALQLATALATQGATAGQLLAAGGPLVGLQHTGAGALAVSQPADGGAGQSSSMSLGGTAHGMPSRSGSGTGVVTSESSAAAALQRPGFTAWLQSLWMVMPGRRASSTYSAHQEADVAAGAAARLLRTCTGTLPTAVPALAASASSIGPDMPAEVGNALSVPSAAAAALSLAGSGWAVGTAVLQVAVFPWQGLWLLSRTAVSASAWTAHSAALVCVRASQYQLLLLLFWLTLVAAAAQAAGAAAAAAWITTSLLLRLADREARIFLCAASVVALTDLKQLCLLLATQPLSLLQVKVAQLHGWGSSTLLMQANPQAQTDTAAAAAPMAMSQAGPLAAVAGAAQGPTAASESVSSRANSAAAPRCGKETGRSGSISLSHVLGGFLGLLLYSRQSSRRLTPGSSASNSRRSSGQGGPAQAPITSALASAVGTAGGRALQATSSSQLIVLRPDSAAAAAVLTPFAAQSQQLGASAAAAEAPMQAAAPATWLAGPTVLLFDSLAVVSGLWAGLGFRLWVLLAVQAPTAGCRIWLHVAKSGCCMSAAAAATSTRTALQVAWHLAHISLMLLQGAAAAGMSHPSTEQQAGASAGLKLSHGTSKQQGLAGWAAAGMFRWVGAAVCGALQGWWLAVAKPFSSFCQLLMPVCMHWAGSSAANSTSTFFLGMPNSLGVWAMFVITTVTAAVRSPRVWVSSVRQGVMLLSQAGLRAVAAKGMQSAGLLVLWLGSWIMGFLERLVVVAAEWLLRDVPPVARAALCGSARMIRGLVVEAGRQSALLAAQLITAWRAHQVDA